MRLIEGWLGGLSQEAMVVLFTVSAIVLGRLLARQLARLSCFWTSRSRALRAVQRTTTAEGPREGQGLWLQAPNYPENYGASFGTPILVLANNKGGVAKTTLAANLGAFWAREWKKKILLIDLDYQGTLSNMALRPIVDQIPRGQDSLATRLISGDLDAGLLVQSAKQVPEEPNLRVVPAFYDLAQAENRLIIEWLLKCAPLRNKSWARRLADLLIGKLFVKDDVRYRLATILHTKAVRDAFDAVIIDCPPRMSTGVIQALCAGTHVLVPAVLDRTSAESVVAFCEELQTLKTKGICPHVECVGVVGTMATAHVDGIAERDALVLVQDGLKRIDFPVGWLDTEYFMRRSTAFVNAADRGIAYISMQNGQRQTEVREAIGALADFLARHVKLPPPR